MLSAGPALSQVLYLPEVACCSASTFATRGSAIGLLLRIDPYKIVIGNRLNAFFFNPSTSD
jgi:hypothetical protein